MLNLINLASRSFVCNKTLTRTINKKLSTHHLKNNFLAAILQISLELANIKWLRLGIFNKQWNKYSIAENQLDKLLV